MLVSFETEEISVIVTAIVCFGLSACEPNRIYVIDGDTVVVNHERIRLKGIDAPEIKGRCANERALAAQATEMLASLLSDRTVTIEPDGNDRYGRILANVGTEEGDVGERILAEGLARKWTRKWGHRQEPWCVKGY